MPYRNPAGSKVLPPASSCLSAPGPVAQAFREESFAVGRETHREGMLPPATHRHFHHTLAERRRRRRPRRVVWVQTFWVGGVALSAQVCGVSRAAVQKCGQTFNGSPAGLQCSAVPRAPPGGPWQNSVQRLRVRLVPVSLAAGAAAHTSAANCAQ